MIIAKNLRKVYAPKKGVEVKALDDVSLKLPDTGMVFILGKSGSGKSTLLNVLGGLDTFDSGEIIIKGQSSKEFKQSHFDSYRNTYVGFIFQEYNILEDFTVGANIALAIELQGRKATNEEINSILDEVGLNGLGSRKPNELSGGQKQRVAIARALVKKPEIIMADEPTGALDSNTGRQVFDTLKELSKTKLILIVSHDREFSELYADRIIELADGKIISDVEYDAESSDSTEEPNLSYSGKEITIKDGYQLTEDDIVSINEYIKKVKSGATLVINDKRREKIFKKTNEDSIVHKIGEKFKLIKSRLSIKNAFKLGSSGLKHKKVRLAFTIILSFIAFSLFGLADAVASYDSFSTCTSSIMDSRLSYASFAKNKKIYYSDGKDYYLEYYGKYISQDDVDEISKQTDLDYTGVVGGNNIYLELRNNFSSSRNDSYNWANVFPEAFSGIASFDKDFADRYDYRLEGNAPSADDEIVITKYVAEAFVKQGYASYNNETHEISSIDISSFSDMIGKTLSVSCLSTTRTFKIVGILDTGFDSSRYEILATESNNGLWGMALYEELNVIKRTSLEAVMFTTESFKNDFLAEFQKDKQNLNNGEFSVIKYKNDDLGLDNSDNLIANQDFWSLKKLSSNGIKIAWIGAPLSSLASNQIIIPFDVLSSYCSYDGGKTDEVKPFDEFPAIGFERDNGEFSCESLYNVTWRLHNIIAYKYALDEANWDSVWTALENMGIATDEFSFRTYNPDTDTYELDKAEARRSFAYNVPNSVHRPYDDNYIKAYYEDMCQRYISAYPELEDRFLSVDHFMAINVKLPGQLGYYTSDMIESNPSDMAYRLTRISFAVSTFESELEKAKNASNGNAPSWYDKSVTDEREMFNRYYNALDSISYSDDFDDALAIAYQELYINKTMESLTPDMLQNIAINYRKNWESDPVSKKDIEIVGVTTGGRSLVVADEIYNELVDSSTEGEYSFIVAPMPTDKSGIEKVVKFYYENGDDVIYNINKNDVKFTLESSVTEQLSMADELLETLGQVFLYVGIGFAVFAALMLSNFIATSISYKKQEIGILRAIGSRSRDVFMIFFAESFIIAMINFLLSVVTTGATVMLINSILREDVGLLITFLSFGIRQVLLLLGASLLVAFIATFLPVKKIASMKPIDAIKNRK